MKLRFAIFILLVCYIVFRVTHHDGTKPGPPKPPVDPPATSAKLLMLYDANNKAKLPDKGALLDSPAFRAWLETHHVDWRIVPSTTTFNDDQPEFQKLDAQERNGDNWLYLDNGRRLRGQVSQALPANEDDAEKLIGRYVK